MINTNGLSDRDILEKLLDIMHQNHAMVCNLSKSMELERHRQMLINDEFKNRINNLECDVKKIKEKIA